MNIKQIAEKLKLNERQTRNKLVQLQKKHPEKQFMFGGKPGVGYEINADIAFEVLNNCRQSRLDRIDRLDVKYRVLKSEHNRLNELVAELQEQVENLQHCIKCKAVQW